MSQYTTQLRWICEMNSGFDYDKLNEGQYSVNEIIDAAAPNIFNFSFPIFAESHRHELEKKILKHYYMQEICCETAELWRLFLDERLNLIMPKYNQLYKMETEIAAKLLQNVDVWQIIDKQGKYDDTTKGTRDTSDSGTTSGTTRDAYSDTPQGTISNVENNSYLTDYRKTTSEGKTTASGKESTSGTKKSTSDEDTQLHEYGYRGGKTYYEMLSDFNDKILNIDEMIIKELRDLFFLLW